MEEEQERRRKNEEAAREAEQEIEKNNEISRRKIAQERIQDYLKHIFECKQTLFGTMFQIHKKGNYKETRELILELNGNLILIAREADEMDAKTLKKIISQGERCRNKALDYLAEKFGVEATVYDLLKERAEEQNKISAAGKTSNSGSAVEADIEDEMDPAEAAVLDKIEEERRLAKKRKESEHEMDPAEAEALDTIEEERRLAKEGKESEQKTTNDGHTKTRKSSKGEEYKGWRNPNYKGKNYDPNYYQKRIERQARNGGKEAERPPPPPPRGRDYGSNSESQSYNGSGIRSQGRSAKMNEMRERYDQAKEQTRILKKQHQSEVVFPRGWEILTEQEFKEAGYLTINFTRDIEKKMIKPFSGYVEDYFRFRETFFKCIHVQPVPIFYKLMALDQLIKNPKTQAMLADLGTTEQAYADRLQRLEEEFGDEDKYQNHLMNSLTELRKFAADDIVAVARFGNLLRTYLNMASPLEAANIPLRQLLKTRIPKEWAREYGMYRARTSKNDDLITLCEFAVEAHEILQKNQEDSKFERELRATYQRGAGQVTGAKKNDENQGVKNLMWEVEEIVEEKGSYYEQEEIVEEKGSYYEQEAQYDEGMGEYAFLNQSKRPKLCWLCEVMEHDIYHCEDFQSYTAQERRNAVIRRQACSICLLTGHESSNCWSTIKCKFSRCGERHHWMLHVKRKNEPVLNNTPPKSETKYTMVETQEETKNEDSEYEMQNGHTDQPNTTEPDTHYVLCEHEGTEYYEEEGAILARAVDGTTKIAKAMLTIEVMNEETGKREYLSVRKTLQRPSNYQRTPNEIRAAGTGRDDEEDLVCLQVDETPRTGLGYQKPEHYWRDRYHQFEGAFKRLYKIENEDEERKLKNAKRHKERKEEEKEAAKRFEQTKNRLADGSFEVGILWKTAKAAEYIRNNYREAKNIFLQQEARMLRTEGAHENFVSTIKDWIAKGFAKEIPKEQHQEGFFIPTFLVVRMDKSTTKFRLILNAKHAFEDGMCLNDYVLPGENLMNRLFDVLIRFRRHKYVVAFDIASMFLKVKVIEQDQKYLRFFFRESKNEEVKVIQGTGHVFGVKSSPHNAMRCIKDYAKERAEQYPLAAKALARDVIVDDILCSSNDKEELKNTVQQVQSLLGEMGMQCHKFAANHEDILEGIPKEKRVQQTQFCEPDEEFESPAQFNSQLPKMKTLGISWNAATDKMSINYNVEGNKPKETFTLRKLLSEGGAFYDPFGALLPVAMTARMVIQQGWRYVDDCNMDEELPQEFGEAWIKWRTHLKNLDDVQIDRCIVDKSKTVKDQTLIVVCDASTRAMAAAGYTRNEYTDGSVDVKLIASRGKVAPIHKQEPIARLECAAALLGTELADQICSAYDWDKNRVEYFTDSLTCLWWLRTKKELETFVATRICKIKDHSEVNQWHHVRTKINSADLPSRGCSTRYLKKATIWWNGPPFVVKPKSEWPKLPQIEETPEAKALTKTTKQSLDKIFLQTEARAYGDFDTQILEMLGNSAKLDRGLRILALVYKAVRLFKEGTQKEHTKEKREKIHKHIKSELKKKWKLRKIAVPKPTVEELQQAEREAIKLCQKKYFPKSKEDEAYKEQVWADFPNVQIFRDEEGVLRVNGRLSKAENYSYDERFPILLPRKSKITEELVQRIHEVEKQHAGGSDELWAATRRKYWIPKGKHLVKQLLRQCSGCVRKNAQKMVSKLAPLHAKRTDTERFKSFTNIGVDLAGPFETKSGPGKPRNKRHMMIFTCYYTRAVDIQMVWEETTQSLYYAFLKHCSIYGPPKFISSDNGPNLMGLKRMFKELRENWNEQAGLIKCNLDEIQWETNPPYAPWWGGHYESLIKVAKKTMTEIVQWPRFLFNDEELQTVFFQVASIMNCRPLLKGGSAIDLDDQAPLTPGTFLNNGEGTPAVFPFLDRGGEPNFALIKREVDKATGEIWARMRNEVIIQLNTLNAKIKEHSKLEVGDVVIIGNTKDPNPRKRWPMGLIEETHQGTDGLVRSVTVRSEGKLKRRDIQNLAKLNIGPSPDNKRFL